MNYRSLLRLTLGLSPMVLFAAIVAAFSACWPPAAIIMPLPFGICGGLASRLVFDIMDH